jgi:hypothetical protein
MDKARTRRAIAERLITLRIDRFGARGRHEMARSLGLKARTWSTYEKGVAVPGEIILKVIELTSAEPAWLLHGVGPRYRTDRPRTNGHPDRQSPRTLIMAALDILQREEFRRVP